jgi:hypothetical protein
VSRRRTVLVVAALGVFLGAAPPFHPPLLVWNASASVPIGLYTVEQPTDLYVSDLVIVRPPEQLESFLADRGYLARGVPLVIRSPPAHRPAPIPRSILVRFFTLVGLAVGAIAVFAPDEVRCAHALGMDSAEPVGRSPTAFSAIGAGESPGG